MARGAYDDDANADSQTASSANAIRDTTDRQQQQRRQLTLARANEQQQQQQQQHTQSTRAAQRQRSRLGSGLCSVRPLRLQTGTVLIRNRRRRRVAKTARQTDPPIEDGLREPAAPTSRAADRGRAAIAELPMSPAHAPPPPRCWRPPVMSARDGVDRAASRPRGDAPPLCARLR